MDAGSEEVGQGGRVEEAAEQYMKLWFVKEKNNVAKRRALEVQNNLRRRWAQGPGGGKKRYRVEGVATATSRFRK